MNKKLITIVNYEIGNLSSVVNSIKDNGYKAKITNNKSELDKSDLLILPGVGTFYKAMNNLNKLNLVEYLKDYAKDGRPLIGICLGMQLFADYSNEILKSGGLGIIPGRVDLIKNPVSHIGWNNIETKKKSCLENFNNSEVYFNHSFAYECSDEFVHATSVVNNEMKKIIACVKKDKTVGLQFHPEKSQQIGKSLLGNLLDQLIE
tara:strand:- start:3102 stop:3716 length:615 start_codon:yes stop_codon:yes gene_type:complete